MKTPPVLFAWLAYILMFSSAFILLGGISASQRFCGRSTANAAGGSVGYFGPVPCDTFYRLPWFTTWYQIAMVVIVPIVLAMSSVHKWRYGVVGLLVPITYLLMATANSFYLQKFNVDRNEGALRAVLAGSIIGAIANYFLIILLGIREEKSKPQET